MGPRIKAAARGRLDLAQWRDRYLGGVDLDRGDYARSDGLATRTRTPLAAGGGSKRPSEVAYSLSEACRYRRSGHQSPTATRLVTRPRSDQVRRDGRGPL